MRILVSNPDTIGDVVLRQPMFHALLEGGHEVMLIVRPLLAPIMGLIAPGAHIAACDAPLYDPRLAPDDPRLAATLKAAAAFEPDTFIAAPYQWTILEERLAASLPNARTIAMNGRRYTDLSWGHAPESSFRPAVVVEVAADLPELKKNERLASAALGRAVPLPEPSLSPGQDLKDLGAAILSRLGLEPGAYWAACVGDAPYSAVRNWTPERWGELLARWAAEHGARFLFIGLAAESATVARVRAAMGDAGSAAAEWTGRDNGDLDVLIGLLAHSRGYIGRDTGPMHLAAAMSRPVLAVFGGGTWPRFIPAGNKSIAITVGVPCAGCEWRCHLPESYCIKQVPVEEVWKAVEEIESGRIKSPRARVLPAGADLLARIGREGAESARRRFTQASIARRQLAQERMNMSDQQQSEFDAGAVFDGLEPKPARREDSIARVAQLQARIIEQARLRGEQAAVIESLREQLSEAKARARDAETRLERRLAELLSATADAAAAKERLRLVESQFQSRTAEADKARRDAEAARQQADAAAETIKRLQAEIAALRAESQQLRQQAAQPSDDIKKELESLRAQAEEAKRARADLAADRDRLLADLRQARADRDAAAQRVAEFDGPASPLAEAQRELGQARADLHDLRVKAQKHESERAALLALCKQREAEAAELQRRVNQLLDSRWRTLGQRFTLGLVKTLPWEPEARRQRLASQNGQSRPAQHARAHGG